jgi:protein-S-isoprenylcysteine O-methyltransferase Ste14
MTIENNPRKADRVSPGFILRMVFNLFLIAAVLAGLLFAPAGTPDWPEAWIFLIGFIGFLLLYGIWGICNDPSQLLERSRAGANVKTWDKIILPLYSLMLIVLFPICALDAVRFGWSSAPVAVKVLGWAGIALAGGIIFWVMRTNTFASRTARIQEDRGQTVVTGGPYRYVRHPMYLGIILLFIGIPLALGSLWGLIPGGVIGLLFIIRTALEDRMLKSELSGYADYSLRVRYRLLPRIW